MKSIAVARRWFLALTSIIVIVTVTAATYFEIRLSQIQDKGDRFEFLDHMKMWVGNYGFVGLASWLVFLVALTVFALLLRSYLPVFFDGFTQTSLLLTNRYNNFFDKLEKNKLLSSMVNN